VCNTSVIWMIHLESWKTLSDRLHFLVTRQGWFEVNNLFFKKNMTDVIVPMDSLGLPRSVTYLKPVFRYQKRLLGSSFERMHGTAFEPLYRCISFE